MLELRNFTPFFQKGDSGEDKEKPPVSEVDLYSVSAKDQIDHNRLYHRMRIGFAVFLLGFVGVWDWRAYGVFMLLLKAPSACMGHAADFCVAASPGVAIAVAGFSAALTVGLLAVVAKLLSPVAYSRREDDGNGVDANLSSPAVRLIVQAGSSGSGN